MIVELVGVLTVDVLPDVTSKHSSVPVSELAE